MGRLCAPAWARIAAFMTTRAAKAALVCRPTWRCRTSTARREPGAVSPRRWAARRTRVASTSSALCAMTRRGASPWHWARVWTLATCARQAIATTVNRTVSAGATSGPHGMHTKLLASWRIPRCITLKRMNRARTTIGLSVAGVIAVARSLLRRGICPTVNRGGNAPIPRPAHIPFALRISTSSSTATQTSSWRSRKRINTHRTTIGTTQWRARKGSCLLTASR
mmetsp:Transcript_3654/g.10976  ORF Transcript_3654/g.10976 Transcript_3654/m.10976 type:complete len:224 (-) Transcript_3654:651-1322(-)